MKQKLLVLFTAAILVTLACTACTKTEIVVVCGHCSAKVSENSQYCSNCGGSLFQNGINSSDTTTNPATDPHATTNPATNPPAHVHSFSTATCTTPSTCSECGEIAGPPVGHTYSSATCDTPQKCTTCGITNGKALGHEFSGGSCTRCGYEDPEKAAQYNSAYRAFQNLTQTAQGVEIIMDAIYNGWYFAIYQADNYSTAKECINAFCNRTGLDHDDVVIAINQQIEYLGYDVSGTTQMAVLRTFSNTVNVITRIYSAKGWYDEFNYCLSSAQNDIMSLTSKYEDITGFSTLKKYYSEVFAYTQFAASPSGSFSQLESTMNTYETNIRKYNNELAFLFLF